eukprot:m.252314 g.252314  ORF g.252314 m.252314 type:complete len:801 (-) comp22660_c0_seq1:22-2424(-)
MRAPVLVTLTAVLALLSSASARFLDNFQSTPSLSLQIDAAGQTFVSQLLSEAGANAQILGGERDLSVIFESVSLPPGRVTAEVTGGALFISVNTGTVGAGGIVWDGVDGSGNINFNGIQPPVDITAEGYSRGIITNVLSDLPTVFTFTVYSGSATAKSSFSFPVPGGQALIDLNITMSDLVGNADLTQVTAFQVSFSSGNSIDVRLGPIEITPDLFCGDGLVTSGEECDDGNTINNDSCNNQCQIVTTTTTTTTATQAPRTQAGAKALERLEKGAKLTAAVSRATWDILDRIMNLLQQWRTADENAFEVQPELLAEPQHCKAQTRRFATSIEASRIFRHCVELSPGRLTAEHWDLILCNLVAWLEVTGDGVLVQALSSQACLLMESVAVCFEHILQTVASGASVPASVTKALREWQDFFLPAAAQQVLALFIQACEQKALSTHVDSVALAVRHATPDLVTIDYFPVLLHGLAQPSVAVQSSCYSLLMKLHSQRGFSGEQLCEFLPLLPVDKNKDSLAERGSMLVWACFCSYFKSTEQEQRVDATTELSASQNTENLMSLVFRYIPQEYRNDAFDSALHTVFPIWDNFSLDAECMGLLAAHAYSRACLGLPALVRRWWTDAASRQEAQRAEQFTMRVLQSLVAEEELRAVEAFKDSSEDFKIRARKAAKEVAATCTIDNSTLELTVALMPAHPLRNVSVTCGARLGISAALWKKWLLQMTTYISNQNGSILEAVLIWKKNIEKHFEGIEDCTICYAVIHDTNYQLPDKKCKTCRNGFHAACLYKWFKNSGQSSCPLCRNLF